MILTRGSRTSRAFCEDPAETGLFLMSFSLKNQVIQVVAREIQLTFLAELILLRSPLCLNFQIRHLCLTGSTSSSFLQWGRGVRLLPAAAEHRVAPASGT